MAWNPLEFLKNSSGKRIAPLVWKFGFYAMLKEHSYNVLPNSTRTWKKKDYVYVNIAMVIISVNLKGNK